ncbi:MAG TPA: DUF4331 domain-containing protein [Candidatus Binataceae bacterium]|nr:DUF4331 domain-containing protein [Candidatus Binataceae bacterium]
METASKIAGQITARIITAICAIVLAGAALTTAPPRATASSHREAPLVTEMPKVDGTDWYMFRSYETGRSDFVTMVANYYPLQDPFGGPNYFLLDPAALYEMKIDNDGDARPDIIFSFQFTNTRKDLTLPINGKNVAVPLTNIGPIPGMPGNLNVVETYTVKVIRPGYPAKFITNASGGSRIFTKPTDNIGCKSFGDAGSGTNCLNDDSASGASYDTYARQFIYNVNIPGCSGEGRLFVGQRKDPFVVNLGETFDLVNYANPVGEAFANTQPNSIGGKNVTSLILEVPISCLVTGKNPIIGGWTTASLPQTRILKSAFRDDQPNTENGDFQQVSRLGMPLVNELVIGLKDKDRFNASEPRDDSQFATYVTNPTAPALIAALFGTPAPTLFPRADLVATFLTGIAGVNQPPHVKPAEMLRLNTSIPVTTCASQSRLGVIGSDSAGFPNGRRPGDDVVDITLRVAMGRLITLGLFGTKSQAPSGALDFTDGAFVQCTDFDTSFPYIKNPLPGSPNGPNGIPTVPNP